MVTARWARSLCRQLLQQQHPGWRVAGEAGEHVVRTSSPRNKPRSSTRLYQAARSPPARAATSPQPSRVRRSRTRGKIGGRLAAASTGGLARNGGRLCAFTNQLKATACCAALKCCGSHQTTCRRSSNSGVRGVGVEPAHTTTCSSSASRTAHSKWVLPLPQHLSRWAPTLAWGCQS
jgi:hypothetical protein